jgi:hypothetical protein
MGFDPEKPRESSSRPESLYQEVYIQLRSRIDLHIQLQLLPILSLSPKPVGAYSWVPNSDSVSTIPEVEFVPL